MKLSRKQYDALAAVKAAWGMESGDWWKIHHRTRRSLDRLGLIRQVNFSCDDPEELHAEACRSDRGYPWRLFLIVLTDSGLAALDSRPSTLDQERSDA